MVSTRFIRSKNRKPSRSASARPMASPSLPISRVTVTTGIRLPPRQASFAVGDCTTPFPRHESIAIESILVALFDRRLRQSDRIAARPRRAASGHPCSMRKGPGVGSSNVVHLSRRSNWGSSLPRLGLAVLLGLVGLQALLPQVGSTGEVRDAESGFPLVGAVVRAPAEVVQTGPAGGFRLGLVPPWQSVVFEADGYHPRVASTWPP